MSERVKRALYLKEELSGKRALYDEEVRKINYLGRELPGIRITLDYLSRKISCLTSITREMVEDIFSRELSRRKNDLRLDKMRTQLKVLREIKDEQIEEERFFHERKEEIIKVQVPHKMMKNVLFEKICELTEEYETSLLEMDENKVPEELGTDYENLRDTEEEDSDELIVEIIEEIIEGEDKDEEPKEPEIKTFFVHDTCCACQEKKPDIFNIPCGHVCMCASCNTKNAKSDKCAICRKVVEKFYAIKSL